MEKIQITKTQFFARHGIMDKIISWHKMEELNSDKGRCDLCNIEAPLSPFAKCANKNKVVKEYKICNECSHICDEVGVGIPMSKIEII